MSKSDEILAEHGFGFEDNFYPAIESWFSADIACCDHCIDEFLEIWPLANTDNDFEFQRSHLTLDCLYSGSDYFFLNYTKEEFDVLKHTIPCPRCGEELDSNIWIYELPFSSDIDIEDFEAKIEEIAYLSKKTPFLILKNKFALEVYDLLHSLSVKTEQSEITSLLYRGRISTQVKKLEHSEFMVAPKEYIGEGRYNHSGNQGMGT